MSEYVHQVSEDEAARIAKFLRLLAIATVSFVILIIVLFITAERWLKLISPEAEHRFVKPYIEWSQETLLRPADPVLQGYVASLATELFSFTEDAQPIRVHVIRGETLNAFATLGGYIFVFEGLVDAVGDENSLAMVLGHELAHVHHRDALLSTGRGMLIQLAISMLTGSGIDPGTLEASPDILLNHYSREQESDADAVALMLLQQKYGHVGGATRLFEILEDQEWPYDEPDELTEWFATHPDTTARISAIKALSAKNGWNSGETTSYPEAVRAVLAD
jgi:predicted Zn-dependent protease